MGRSQTSRAARTAISNSATSLKVSNRITSEPASHSTDTCSWKAAWASSTVTEPYGASRAPSGPTSPAMKMERPDTSRTSRTSRTARKFRSRTFSARSYLASRTRFEPKVWVLIMSAPALANAWWMSLIQRGRLRTRYSRHCSLPAPRAKSIVPIAPSLSNGCSDNFCKNGCMGRPHKKERADKNEKAWSENTKIAPIVPPPGAAFIFWVAFLPVQFTLTCLLCDRIENTLCFP